MKDSKKAILVVSFGTSYKRTREQTIGAIERKIAAAYPGWEVRRAFTSGFIIKKIRREQDAVIDTVDEALARASEDGITHLVVQPTHLMNGAEYEKLADLCRQADGLFDRICIAAPLLSTSRDTDAVIEAITKMTACYLDGKTAVCFMGHGTAADSNKVYENLQESLRAKGYVHHYIGTVEAAPSLADLIDAVNAQQIYERVILQPLMIVAGDHAVNDMAGGQKDSWKSLFEAAGYEVICILEGLGQNEDIQKLYVQHTKEAMAAMDMTGEDK